LAKGTAGVIGEQEAPICGNSETAQLSQDAEIRARCPHERLQGRNVSRSASALLSEHTRRNFSYDVTFKTVEAMVGEGLTRITAILAAAERQQLRSR
jgi:hypothetical protein